MTLGAGDLVNRDHWGKAAERGWQDTLQQTLTTLGWSWMHVYPLRTADGGFRTSTAVRLAALGQAGRARSGWPDLVCIRREWIIAIEVKGYDARGRPTPFQPGQVEWLEQFAGLGSGRAWVLRPTDDWQRIVAWLRFPADAPSAFGWSDADRH